MNSITICEENKETQTGYKFGKEKDIEGGQKKNKEHKKQVTLERKDFL